MDKTREPDLPAISPAEKEKILKREAAVAEEKKREETARAHLLKGRKLFAQGDFEGAYWENQTIITSFQGKSPVEEALFIQALIQAHPGNPNKDYSKSLDLMKRLVKEYPNGFFSQQAKAWINLLLVNEKVGKEHEKLIKEHEKLIKEHEKMSKMLEEYKQVDIEIEDKKREKGR